MKKITLLLTLVSLLVFATACSVENTEKMIENAIEAQENLDSYYAEVSSTFVMEGESETSSYKEWHAKPNKNRMEMDDASLLISNGEQSWLYDENENTVLVFDELDDMSEEMPSESEIMREMLTEMMNSNEVIVKGKETIAEQKTIHLSLTPKEGQDAELFAMDYEIWIDEKTYMPLKMKMATDEFSTEMEYTHIEYNIEIDEEMFTFDIPEGATVQTMEDFMPEVLTLDELQEKASFDVPEITYIPDGYELEDATYFEDMNMAMVNYGDAEGDKFLMISLSSDQSDNGIEEEETEVIQIGDYEGTYMTMYEMLFISWNTDALQIELTSTDDLSKEELIKVAEGIQ